MTSVTRDKRKYGAPTTGSRQAREKRERTDRGFARLTEHQRDLARGRKELNWDGDGSRIMPLIEEDEQW